MAPRRKSGTSVRSPGLLGVSVLSVVLALGGCSADVTPSPEPNNSSSTEVLAKGAQLYAANCQVCHGDQEGRGLTQGAPPHNEAGHTWHHPDAQLKDWVMKGKLGFGQMPAFEGKLTEAEVDAILTYIKTWWTPEQRESQANVSRRYQEALDKYNSGPQ